MKLNKQAKFEGREQYFFSAALGKTFTFKYVYFLLDIFIPAYKIVSACEKSAFIHMYILTGIPVTLKDIKMEREWNGNDDFLKNNFQSWVNFEQFRKIYWSQKRMRNGNDDISSEEHFDNSKTRRGSHFLLELFIFGVQIFEFYLVT